MKVLRAAPGHAIGRYGSVAASARRLADLADGAVTEIRLAAGGVLGRHPAAVPQLFVVVAGEGTVSGSDDVPEAVSSGDAVFWEEGEEHETRTEAGLVAVVLESASFRPRIRG